LLLLLMVGLAVKIVRLRKIECVLVRCVTAVLPRGPSHDVLMCEITLLVVIFS